MATLLESLSIGEVRMRFVKADGSERNMRATLDPSRIPEIPNNGIPERTRLGLITVWDIDLGQWRSFREDQVLSWTSV